MTSTTPVCTMCCLPLSLHRNAHPPPNYLVRGCADAGADDGHTCYMYGNTRQRVTLPMIQHLVSMRIASAASSGFSRMSPSISTTCISDTCCIKLLPIAIATPDA